MSSRVNGVESLWKGPSFPALVTLFVLDLLDLRIESGNFLFQTWSFLRIIRLVLCRRQQLSQALDFVLYGFNLLLLFLIQCHRYFVLLLSAGVDARNVRVVV